MFCTFFFKPFNEGRCELILDQLYKGNAVFLDRLYFKRYVIFKDSFFSEPDCPGKHRMIAIWHSKVSSVQMYKPDFWLMTTYLKVHTRYFLCRSTKKWFIRLITEETFLKDHVWLKVPFPRDRTTLYFFTSLQHSGSNLLAHWKSISDASPRLPAAAPARPFARPYETDLEATWRKHKKEHKRRAEAEQPAKPRHSDGESQNGCRAVHRCACQISTTHDWQLSGDVDIVSEQVGTTWCLTQSQCWIWWLCRRFSRQLIIQSCLKSEVKMKHSQIVKKMEHEVQMFGLMF